MPTSPFAPIQPGKNAFTSDLKAINSPVFKVDKDSDGESFPNLFASFFKNANDSQNVAADYTKTLLTGNLTNTHEMTIAGAKSEVMLHMATQITSKLSSAATTLFQMQI